MSTCQACGAPKPDGARFCEKCGASFSEAVPPAPPAGEPPAPPVPPPPAPPMAAPAAPQFAVAPPAKKRGKAVPIVIAVVALILVLAAGAVAWVMVGPMSKDDYEDQAQDYAGDLYDAQSEIDSAFYVMYYSMDALENDTGVPWPEDELESSEVDEARDAFDEKSEEIVAAAAEIEKLRAPGAYKTEDAALVAWSQYMVDEWLPQYEELLVKAEKGMTYGDFSEDYDDLMNALSEDGDKIWEDYTDAADELNID